MASQVPHLLQPAVNQEQWDKLCSIENNYVTVKSKPIRFEWRYGGWPRLMVAVNLHKLVSVNLRSSLYWRFEQFDNSSSREQMIARLVGIYLAYQKEILTTKGKCFEARPVKFPEEV